MSLQIGDCFKSVFGNLSYYGILIAIVFTVVWLIPYQPPMLKKTSLWDYLIFGAFTAMKKPLLWVFFASGAIITVCAMCIIQNPLNMIIGEAFYNNWGMQFIEKWILLLAIPSVLITGLVQEGAKVFPMAIYWWKNKKTIDPKWALIIGAVSGAGFGFIEAQWLHNSVFFLGWSWKSVSAQGFIAIAPFMESFFSLAFHTASCALVSYGLAKGRGWQFYLILVAVHALMQYSSTFVRFTFSGLADTPQLIIIVVFIIICSLAVSAVALLLLWKKLVADSREKTVG